MSVRKIIVTKNPQTNYIILYTSSLWFAPFRTMLITIGDFVYPGAGIVLSKFSIVCFTFFLILPIFINKEKLTYDMFLIFSFLVLSWLLGIVKNIDSLKINFNIGISIFLKAFPYYCIARKIKNWSETKDYFYVSGLLAALFTAIATLFACLNGILYTDGAIYNQFYGLMLCPSMIISFIAFWEKGSIIHLLNIGITSRLIFLYGSRSPFLCLAIAICLMALKSIDQTMRFKRIKKHICLMIGFSGLAFISGIGILLNSMSSIREGDYISGEGNRLLILFQRGSLLQSDERIQIYRNVLRLIAEHPLIGTGMITDRRLLAELNGEFINFGGYYSHNFFLEILLQYGIFLGGFLAITILYAIYSGVFKDKNINRSILSIFCISYGLGLVMVSGTAFAHEEFWLFMGTVVTMWVEKRISNKNPVNKSPSTLIYTKID